VKDIRDTWGRVLYKSAGIDSLSHIDADQQLTISRKLRVIPWLLVFLRLALAPLMLWVAKGRLHERTDFAVILIAALISDIGDGMLARRWGCSTIRLRVADSAVDTVFYLGVAAAVILQYPQVFRANVILLLVLFVFETARYCLDYLRFRRMASYHSYLAKAWGLLLTAASVSLLCFGRFPFMATIAIAWGILCDAEGLAISLILREWTPDVKTLAKALELRRSVLVAKN
jgi:CDP-diacylglycerol--glycerol-3-phosphate 3-phosphatidyltransferase